MAIRRDFTAVTAQAEILDQIGRFSQNGVRNLLDRRADIGETYRSGAKSRLWQSIDYGVDERKGEIAIFSEPYLINLSDGRRPGAPPPPRQPILLFMENRGIVPRPEANTYNARIKKVKAAMKELERRIAAAKKARRPLDSLQTQFNAKRVYLAKLERQAADSQDVQKQKERVADAIRFSIARRGIKPREIIPAFVDEFNAIIPRQIQSQLGDLVNASLSPVAR